MATSIFAGLPAATISESGLYLPGGFRFKLKIKACKVNQPRQGPPAFIADFEVLESSCPDIKVGEERNWYQKQNDSFAAAVLEFLAAGLGFDHRNKEHAELIDRDVKPRAIELAEAAVGTSQILAGKIVNVETIGKATRGGGDFTKHIWSPAA